jgi:hypothetical protein
MSPFYDERQWVRGLAGARIRSNRDIALLRALQHGGQRSTEKLARLRLDPAGLLRQRL